MLTSMQKVMAVFERCQHVDGTIACEDEASYRYQARAFEEFNIPAAPGAWAVYDLVGKCFVPYEDLDEIDINEKVPLS